MGSTNDPVCVISDGESSDGGVVWLDPPTSGPATAPVAPVQLAVSGDGGSDGESNAQPRGPQATRMRSPPSKTGDVHHADIPRNRRRRSAAGGGGTRRAAEEPPLRCVVCGTPAQGPSDHCTNLHCGYGHDQLPAAFPFPSTPGGLGTVRESPAAVQPGSRSAGARATSAAQAPQQNKPPPRGAFRVPARTISAAGNSGADFGEQPDDAGASGGGGHGYGHGGGNRPLNGNHPRFTSAFAIGQPGLHSRCAFAAPTPQRCLVGACRVGPRFCAGAWRASPSAHNDARPLAVSGAC